MLLALSALTAPVGISLKTVFLANIKTKPANHRAKSALGTRFLQKIACRRAIHALSLCLVALFALHPPVVCRGLCALLGSSSCSKCTKPTLPTNVQWVIATLPSCVTTCNSKSMVAVVVGIYGGQPFKACAAKYPG